MLTYMGFEAYDPTNMYQYSYAYDFGNRTVWPKPYTTLMMLGYLTLCNGCLQHRCLVKSAENSAGYELALAYTGIENFHC